MLWVPGVIEEQNEINFADNAVQNENVIEVKTPTQRAIQQLKEKRQLLWEDDASFFSGTLPQTGMPGQPSGSGRGGGRHHDAGGPTPGNTRNNKSASGARPGPGRGGANEDTSRSIALEAAKLKSTTRSVKDRVTRVHAWCKCQWTNGHCVFQLTVDG